MYSLKSYLFHSISIRFLSNVQRNIISMPDRHVQRVNSLPIPNLNLPQTYLLSCCGSWGCSWICGTTCCCCCDCKLNWSPPAPPLPQATSGSVSGVSGGSDIGLLSTDGSADDSIMCSRLSWAVARRYEIRRVFRSSSSMVSGCWCCCFWRRTTWLESAMRGGI